MSHQHLGPWSKCLSQLPQNPNQRTFFPTIQQRLYVAFRANKYAIDPDQQPNAAFSQSASLLHLNYGKTLDEDIMASDVVYAFHELFLFCAFSEAQFLKILESKIPDGHEFDHIENLGHIQSKLIYIQKILETHGDRLRNNIEAIASRGSTTWPRPSDAVQQTRCADEARSLQNDYEFLLSRTTRLSESCSAKMTLLMSRAMLAESSKAIMQAEAVTRLTRLAFIFVPISFTATFFSMHLYPIANDSPNGPWIWFAVSVPFT